MGIFNQNITNELSLIEKIRIAINEVLDNAVDLVNNHFGDCQLNIVGFGNYQTLLSPNTTMSFLRESDKLLRKLCGSEFGNSCGLLIMKPVALKTIVSEPTNKTDSVTTYEVKVRVDCFVDDSSILTTGVATMYTDTDFFYEKTIYNQPHWS